MTARAHSERRATKFNSRLLSHTEENKPEENGRTLQSGFGILLEITFNPGYKIDNVSLRRGNADGWITGSCNIRRTKAQNTPCRSDILRMRYYSVVMNKKINKMTEQCSRLTQRRIKY